MDKDDKRIKGMKPVVWIGFVVS